MQPHIVKEIVARYEECPTVEQIKAEINAKAEREGGQIRDHLMSVYVSAVQNAPEYNKDSWRDALVEECKREAIRQAGGELVYASDGTVIFDSAKWGPTAEDEEWIAAHS